MYASLYHSKLSIVHSKHLPVSEAVSVARIRRLWPTYWAKRSTVVRASYSGFISGVSGGRGK